MEGATGGFYDLNDIKGPKVRRPGLISYMSFLSFTCARGSKWIAEGRRLSLGAQSGSQFALNGLGPDAGDPFRFTWWTTRDGDRVWVRHRGRWRAGVIVERGREYVRLEIETPDGRSTRVRKLYSELRRVK